MLRENGRKNSYRLKFCGDCNRHTQSTKYLICCTASNSVAFAHHSTEVSMQKILVSACLLGVNCKYSGKNNENESIKKLSEKYELVPVCPEELGGLSTPRPPAEIIGERVLTVDGNDVTENFFLGAEKTLQIAQQNHCTIAILKEGSPSCGSNTIYDGTFSGTKKQGSGITTHLLRQHGIKVYSEDDISFI